MAAMPETLPDGAEPRLIIPELAQPPVPDAQSRKWVLDGRAFATEWRVTLYSRDAVEVKDRVQAFLDRIDTEMSPYRADSDLTRFNMAPEGSFVPLPHLMREVVGRALEVAEQTHGAYDPALLDAVELWGFGAKVVASGVPEPAQIAALTHRKTGWRDLRLDARGMVRPAGVRLDLNAIAKGFAVDGVVQFLRDIKGISAALVEIGGEVKGFGVHPDGLPFWVEIERPHTSLTRSLIALCGKAVATSGDTQRFFVHEGEILSHTIDAQTASPARNGISSVTVIADDCWRADALATALMVMGRDKALNFADVHGIACLIRSRHAGGFAEIESAALKAWL